MKKKQIATVKRTELLIAPGKSKRLAAMRRQSVDDHNSKEALGFKKQGNLKEQQIQKARETIRQRVADIKATYPQGMQNKLFVLRFGSAERIKQLTLHEIFVLLNIKQVLAKEVGQLEFQDKLK